ncbi:MAG: TIGR03617 family F420-dependent LLM class oxidoreductase [Desertimonas sp.]
MHVDVMTQPAARADVARLAGQAAEAGFSGLVFTEMSQPPWLSIVTAHDAAPGLDLMTGIAVAFPRSPMITAQLAWELAEVTDGHFRLGLGSQVRAHIERRYGAEFDPPVKRMRDYVLAVKASWAGFGGARLAHHGDFYRLSLLPAMGVPRRHDHEDLKIDIAAVGNAMVRTAGEVADGIHVHPLHSASYLEHRLLPALREGTAAAGREVTDVDLIVPVFAVPGDTPEERALTERIARSQIAFYGSTRNYAYQFDDLGFEGTSARLNERLKTGDVAGMSALITDEMLDHFAIVCRWDELADRLTDRYADVAHRVVMYTAAADIARHPDHLGRWGEVARAVRTR